MSPRRRSPRSLVDGLLHISDFLRKKTCMKTLWQVSSAMWPRSRPDKNRSADACWAKLRRVARALKGRKHTFHHLATSHRRSCPASSVWQGAGTRHWPKPREPLLRCASTYLSWHHKGSPCIPVRPPRALPTTPSHPHHTTSQERPPQVKTGKTGTTQSISKAVRGLPIVERCGSIVPGLHRVPCPFSIFP